MEVRDGWWREVSNGGAIRAGDHDGIGGGTVVTMAVTAADVAALTELTRWRKWCAGVGMTAERVLAMVTVTVQRGRQGWRWLWHSLRMLVTVMLTCDDLG